MVVECGWGTVVQILVWGGVERSVCGVERSKEIEMISKWTRRCQRVFGFEWTKGWMGIKWTPVASKGMEGEWEDVCGVRAIPFARMCDG